MSNTVSISETPVIVEVVGAAGTTEVIRSVAASVQVVTQGPQGIKGDQGNVGPQGPPGESAQGYKHTQTSPAATWTITHNLGFYPSVELLNTGSQEIEGDVVHLSQNVTVAYFTTPIAGFARLI